MYCIQVSIYTHPFIRFTRIPYIMLYYVILCVSHVHAYVQWCSLVFFVLPLVFSLKNVLLAKQLLWRLFVFNSFKSKALVCIDTLAHIHIHTHTHTERERRGGG